MLESDNSTRNMVMHGFLHSVKLSKQRIWILTFSNRWINQMQPRVTINPSNDW